MTTLAEVIREIHSFDEEPVSWQEPTIYAAEPWSAHSQAIVSWSMPKGSLPDDAARLRLVRLVEVRTAIRLLAENYDQLVAAGRFEEICAQLITHVTEAVATATRTPLDIPCF